MSAEKKPAPSDDEAELVYEECVRRAAGAGLLVLATGGVAILAVPHEQRKAGIRASVLGMAGLHEEDIRRESPPPA